MQRYDLAIIGLGGIGSATAWFAARSGQSVVGLERFDLGGHHHGASHDHSRIIRHSYHTPHYVRLTHLAYNAWREAEAESGETCVHITGGIDLFPCGAAIDIETYRESMRSGDVAFDELTAADVMARWPAWQVAADTEVLYQANTGIVSPAMTVPLLQRLATDRGASLHGNANVTAIEPAGDDVAIRLADGTELRAAQVVVAADAWTAPLVEPLGTTLPLTVTREQVTYYGTDTPQAFEPANFPVWIWMDDPSFYGFPTFGRPGVKIAQDCGGTPVDPDTRGFEPDPSILARTDAFAAMAFGGLLGPALSTTTCLYTLPPDRDFVVDALPDHPNIHVALGAGHGYKFVAWFGKTLAALVAGRDPGCDLTPFALNRPALTDPAWEPNWLV
ncbi:MAG: N-methyl-L-tryptophan oxidase [Ilumatobacteraceae bacterium]|nr:N-methyl-L-tryptophan oxidase [Ilumatobacteraceae bacterium]